ncbi:MAG: hypothetical protein FGM44_12695 [Limnohabitans sp.]|nr:hypothetical protein [Limnohabitans sp.]
MAVINTNSKALFSQASLKSTDRSMSVAMQQLSSGKRINSARDDAAGLSIVTRMTHQIRSLNQAVRNAGDAINLIQTAEGATGEINDMMTRMRELAIQAVNDTNSNADRSYLDLEFQQLKQQIVQIADNTEWNGFSVLNGKGGQQVGEMPLYKVTSDTHFGDVFIQPTTAKSFSGTDAGEIQQFNLSGTSGGVGTISVAGQDIAMTSSERTLAQAADRIVNTINTSSNFVANGVTASHVVPNVVTTDGTASTTESAAVTFANMKKGQSVTVAGKTLTAATDLTGAQVASAYAAGTIAAGSGTFSGALAGFTAGAAATNSVTFTSTTANTNVTDITVAGTVSLTYSGADGNVDRAAIEVKSGNMLADNATVIKATTVREAVTQAVEAIANTGKFLQSGSLEFSIPSGAAAGSAITAVFTNSDNQQIQMTGSLSSLKPATVTFSQTTGSNGSVVSGDLTYQIEDATGAYLDLTTTPRALTMTVGVQGSIPAMREGDLTINGVSVGPSVAADDLLSPRNNASGSAIAIAAAINRVAVDQGTTQGEIQSLTFSGTPQVGTITVGGVSVVLTSAESTPALAAAKIAAALKGNSQFDSSSGRTVSYSSGSSTISISYAPSEGKVDKIDVQPGATGLGSVVNTTQEYATQRAGTGVFAKVNANVYSGQSMTNGPIATGVVFVNGFASANITTVFNNSQATRQNTVNAINAISDKTGVKAIDTGSDAKGIQLVATDGRNIEVRFEAVAPANAVAFGQRIGMREGVQSATVSLESKVQTPVVLGTVQGGDISRAGLISGDYTKNQAVLNTSARAPVDASTPQINTVNLTGTVLTGDVTSVVVNGKSYSVTAAATSTPQAVTSTLITNINNDTTSSVFASRGSNVGEIVLTSRVPGTSFTLAATSVPVAGSTGAVSTAEIQPSHVADVKSLTTGDLVINGVPIRATRDVDDPNSNTLVSSSDPASSAIAIAAAINDSTTLTGVKAVANPAESVGSVTTTNAPVSGVQSLYVNGVKIDVDFVQNEGGADRRAKVVTAINQRTGQHGVVATDNGQGVTLSTTDGRNMSVWFDSSVQDLNASDFGLSKGGEVAQQTKIQLTGGTAAAADTVTVTVNGVTVTATSAAGNDMSTAATAAQKLADAINNSGTLKNLRAVSYSDGSILITSSVPGSAFDVRGAATSGTSPTMTINTVTANSAGKTDVTAVNLTSAYKAAVLGNANAPLSYMGIKTVYGSVRMISAAPVLPTLPGSDGLTPSSLNSDGRPIVITAGGDGFGALSNFRDLGFKEGSFGGRASTDMDPPRVGRMAFQVGASANQYITIDLADFGKKGPITGDITGDVDLAVESRSVRINTREGAQAVLALLDGAMDKVNATRATMGAVMNRLDHVINNLNNVSMNLSSSRSQIEDADYAKASTDLARAQILQQAATAVLAQANTSQQSVLKLLGNGG